MDGNNQVSFFLVGNTNDCNFNTIQEALDNVEENSVIQVKPGIYNEHLSFTKKVHLIGCNESIKNKSSAELPIVVLDSDKSCEIDVPVKIEGIVFTHKKDLRFDSILSFIKTSQNFEDKEQEEFRSLLLINSESDFNNIAILCSEENGIAFSKLKSNFNDSFIHHTAFIGVYIANDAASTINNCIITDSNIIGIMVTGTATPVINSCRIEKGNNVGIRVEGNSSPKVSFSEVKDVGLGVNICESSTGMYEGCNVHHNKFGFSIDNQASPQISKCIIHNNENIGISPNNDSKPIIKDCEIFGNERGVFVDDDSNPEITRCEIYNNKNSGVVSMQSSKVMMHLCEIYNQPVGIIIQESAHNGFYERCLIHDCNDFGVLIKTTNTINIKDSVIYENGIGVQIQNGVLKITGSEIYKNTGNGINIMTELIGSYEYCDIHDNSIGVFVTSSQKPNFDTCKIYDNAKVNIEFFHDMVNKLFR